MAWVVLVLLFPVLGSAAWFVFGRLDAASRPGKGERSSPHYPEYERPGRSAAVDPEKDEESFRQVRARAEEQRKLYAEEKREQQEPELEDGPAE